MRELIAPFGLKFLFANLTNMLQVLLEWIFGWLGFKLWSCCRTSSAPHWWNQLWVGDFGAMWWKTSAFLKLQNLLLLEASRPWKHDSRSAARLSDKVWKHLIISFITFGFLALRWNKHDLGFASVKGLYAGPAPPAVLSLLSPLVWKNIIFSSLV